MAAAKLSYFSDVLCIWAFAAQVRLDELATNFGDDIDIEHRFISVFGDTNQRIGDGWKAKGGFDGFADHVEEVAERFPHIEISEKLWRKTRPTTSGNAHLVLKAAQLAADRKVFERLLWETRVAFFVDGRDISNTAVLFDLVDRHGLQDAVKSGIADGSAIAALINDYEMKATHSLQGSPTYFLNDRRQILYGNVGYRIIEANVQEILRDDTANDVSWC